jgi:hypothetical protein
MPPRPITGLIAALILAAESAAAPLAMAHDVMPPASGSLYVLTPGQREDLVAAMLAQKPNPGYFAVASAVIPGAGQVALGEWQEPATVWALLLAASMALYAVCEGVVNVHPAFLATTPYVFTSGVTIPGSARCAKVEVIYNRALMLSYLGAAGYTAWRTYDLAMRRRAEIDRDLVPLLK